MQMVCADIAVAERGGGWLLVIHCNARVLLPHSSNLHILDYSLHYPSREPRSAVMNCFRVSAVGNVQQF